MAFSAIIQNGTPLIDLRQDTVNASNTVSGITGHKNDGQTFSGTLTSRDSTDLSVSGATVTVPAGVYTSQATKSVSTMTLPTAAASSATSGYTSKATIGRSTSTQYINIPAGYNSAGAYYLISAVSNMTLPTAASTSSSGTSKATISRSTSAQYINIPTGYNDTASYYTISATPNGTVTAPASISGTAATVSTGTNTLTLTKTISVTPAVSTAGYISAGTAGNSSVSLTASVTTKAAATYYPSTSDQSVAASQYLTGAQTIKAVTTSNLTADNIKNGVTVTVGDSADADRIVSVTGTYSGEGSAKNVQAYRGSDSVAATTYTDTDLTITVAKTGTYNVTWSGWRNTTSGTSGSQLYKNGTAVGSASTTFTNSYGQVVSLTNQSFNKDDVLVVRARSRATNYSMYVANLVIEEV